jgi:integrase
MSPTTTSRNRRPRTSPVVPARLRGAGDQPSNQRTDVTRPTDRRRTDASRASTSSSAAPAKAQRGRPRTGSVREWTRQDGDRGFGVTFLDQHDERQYERCGMASEGWSRARAQIALEDFLQAVAEDTYTAATNRSDTIDPDPLFEDYAAEVIAVHGDEVSEQHRAFLSNALRNHLKPEFRGERLSAVNRAKRLTSFRSKQLRKMRQIRRAAERGTPLCRENGQPLSLSERTINHVFHVLAFIIEKALWDDEIDVVFNAARNPNLHVRVPKRTYRDWLEPDELLSLLDAAELIDQPTRASTLVKAMQARRLRGELGMTVAQTAAEMGISEGGVCYLCSRERIEQVSMTRTIIAVLGASGTRNTELCRLRSVDLDFVHRKIRIPRAKTAAGIREIDMTPWLQRQLEAYVTSLGPDHDPEAPLFSNGRGNPFNKDTLNKRLKRVHEAAGEMRQALKLPPLPTKLTAHVFRRTFITLMIEAGAPLSYVQELAGHEDQATTVRIYNRVLKMRDTKRFGRAFDELMANAVPA